MPNNILKKWADEYNISLKKLEGNWEEAIEIAEETFGKDKKNFKDKEYKYIMGIVKNMNKIKESRQGLTEAFLKSDKSAKSFIEELGVISSDIAIDNTIVNDAYEEEEDEFEEVIEDDYAVESFDTDNDIEEEDYYSEYDDDYVEESDDIVNDFTVDEEDEIEDPYFEAVREFKGK